MSISSEIYHDPFTFILEELKREAQASKKYTPKDPFKTGPKETDETDEKKIASGVKCLYDAYIAVGFTEQQAFDLIKTTLTTLI